MRTAFGVLPSYCWWTLELLGERDYLVPLLPLDFMGIEERKGWGVCVGGGVAWVLNGALGPFDLATGPV